MSVDLEDQIRAYAELLDTTVPELDTYRIQSGFGEVRPAGPGRTRRVVALAAAALVLTGVVAAIILSSDDQGANVITTITTAPPTSTPPPESSVPEPDATDEEPPAEPVEVPVDWDMAVTPSPDVFTTGVAIQSSIEQMAAALRQVTGVTRAEVVGDRIEIDVETLKALEGTDVVFYGWGRRIPEDQIHFSSEALEALTAIGEERAADFRHYLESVAGTPGPLPEFDTAALGTQVPSAVPAEFSDPPLTVTVDPPLNVTIEGTGVQARLFHPDPGVLGPRDVVRILGNPTDSLQLTLSCTCADGFDFGASIAAFGPGLDRADEIGLTEDGRRKLIASATWGDMSAVSIAGLPVTVSVVATELADGTLVWQRPMSGIALFTFDDQSSDLSMHPPAVTGYDADGTVVFVER